MASSSGPLIAREAEIVSLQKELFNMKLRVFYLEEKAQRRKAAFNPSGSASASSSNNVEDQVEELLSENFELKLLVEEKNQELEQRNVLLVKARGAIENLQAEVELAREEVAQASESQAALQAAGAELSASGLTTSGTPSQLFASTAGLSVAQLHSALADADTRLAEMKRRDEDKNLELARAVTSERKLALDASKTNAELQAATTTIAQLQAELVTAANKSPQMDPMVPGGGVGANGQGEASLRALAAALAEKDRKVKEMEADVESSKLLAVSREQQVRDAQQALLKVKSDAADVAAMQASEVQRVEAALQDMRGELVKAQDELVALRGRAEEQSTQLHASRQEAARGRAAMHEHEAERAIAEQQRKAHALELRVVAAEREQAVRDVTSGREMALHKEAAELRAQLVLVQYARDDAVAKYEAASAQLVAAQSSAEEAEQRAREAQVALAEADTHLRQGRRFRDATSAGVGRAPTTTSSAEAAAMLSVRQRRWAHELAELTAKMFRWSRALHASAMVVDTSGNAAAAAAAAEDEAALVLAMAGADATTFAPGSSLGGAALDGDASIEHSAANVDAVLELQRRQLRVAASRLDTAVRSLEVRRLEWLRTLRDEFRRGADRLVQQHAGAIAPLTQRVDGLEGRISSGRERIDGLSRAQKRMAVSGDALKAMASQLRDDASDSEAQKRQLRRDLLGHEHEAERLRKAVADSEARATELERRGARLAENNRVVILEMEDRGAALARTREALKASKAEAANAQSVAAALQRNLQQHRLELAAQHREGAKAKAELDATQAALARASAQKTSMHRIILKQVEDTQAMIRQASVLRAHRQLAAPPVPAMQHGGTPNASYHAYGAGSMVLPSSPASHPTGSYPALPTHLRPLSATLPLPMTPAVLRSGRYGHLSSDGAASPADPRGPLPGLVGGDLSIAGNTRLDALHNGMLQRLSTLSSDLTRTAETLESSSSQDIVVAGTEAAAGGAPAAAGGSSSAAETAGSIGIIPS